MSEYDSPGEEIQDVNGFRVATSTGVTKAQVEGDFLSGKTIKEALGPDTVLGSFIALMSDEGLKGASNTEFYRSEAKLAGTILGVGDALHATGLIERVPDTVSVVEEANRRQGGGPNG